MYGEEFYQLQATQRQARLSINKFENLNLYKPIAFKNGKMRNSSFITECFAHLIREASNE